MEKGEDVETEIFSEQKNKSRKSKREGKEDDRQHMRGAKKIISEAERRGEDDL